MQKINSTFFKENLIFFFFFFFFTNVGCDDQFGRCMLNLKTLKIRQFTVTNFHKSSLIASIGPHAVSHSSGLTNVPW